MITAGRGKSNCDGQEIQVEPDMTLWVKAGKKKQIINKCDKMMKLLTVFTPAYKAKDLLGGILEAARRDS